jgi:hypothetical protein
MFALWISASWSQAMSKLPAQHPFRKHSENLRAVAAGLKQAQRAHKAAISRNDDGATDFLSRIHQVMIGLLAEAELRKIVNDPDGFNDKERSVISQERTQLSRWKRSVELAIRRHYSVPLHLEISDANTAQGVTGQYGAIVNLLDNHLALVIEDRNKLAHAQWKWLLNNPETAFAGPAVPPLNYLASKRRGEIITRIARLVYTLAVSESTFQRDYSLTYSEITTIKADINGSDYPIWVKELRSRRR